MSATAPSGMLMWKIQRQFSCSVKHPPSSGQSTVPTPISGASMLR
nr:hypothetical protein [Actinopolyspora mzabensis]